jgi:hypothetical protein
MLLTPASGRPRLLAARPGKDPIPFVQTQEETSWPFVVMGEREIAFEMGVAPNQTLAVASASDGRMLRRLSATQGLTVVSLASSPDGNTLYYVASGTVWSIPATGGEPRKIVAGDEVTADPSGRQLIVMRYEKEGYRMVRVSLPDGTETPLPFQSGFRLISEISPTAVNRDGRMLVGVQSPDSWWDEVATLDLKTGKVVKLEIPYSGDIDFPGWTPDGRIIAHGFPMRASLWRFRKEKP